MAEEFPSGVCSGSWWTRSGFDGSVAAAAAAASAVSSVSCSAAIGDMGSYGWPVGAVESKARSGEESAASVSGGSSVTFQDSLKVQISDPISSSGFLMDSSMPMAGFGLPSPTIDWSQAWLRSSGRTDQSSFNAMLQGDLSSRSYLRQETAVVESNPVHSGGARDPSINLFKDMNQAFLLDSHLNSGGGGADSSDCTVISFPAAVSGHYGCPSSTSTLLQGLFEQDLKPQPSSYDSRSTNYTSPMNSYRTNESSPTSWSRIPQFFKASSPKQQQQQQPTSHHQLQLSNNTPFWNASAAAVNDMRSGFYSSPSTQFVPQVFEEKPNRSSITAKSNSEGTRGSNASKKSGGEPAFKKPRIETPSPLPTFKVRKEKLGDRITALQQLVSPFGKTDTASVLFEAIEYIKFLHDQVNVLSTPYLKNGPPMQHQQNSDKSKDGEGPKQDLRSRGLCLVPISSTFPVANEPTADVWTAAFGGAYR